jgi:lipopolysaccharide transport system permease protein
MPDCLLKLTRPYIETSVENNRSGFDYGGVSNDFCQSSERVNLSRSARAALMTMTTHDRPTSLPWGVSAAWQDWLSGTRNVELWWTLACYDVVLRYRRSMLGPLWLTLSMGLMLLGMGPLYSVLFNIPAHKFFPHLTLGIIFWNFFSMTINDGCNTFIGAAPYLKSASFPLSVFVWRNLARNVIQLAHHVVLFIPVAIWAGISVTPRLGLVVPGLFVTILNLHAMSISLGILCARFRDVSLLVASTLQLLMFLTPVFWLPDSLPDRAHYILYNPLAQLLDILRLPLLGGVPASGTWWFLLYFTAINLTIAAALYVLKRRQVIYWL